MVRYLASWTSMITSSNYWSMGNNRSSMVSGSSVNNRGSMVSRGSVDNRGSIGRSSLNNWSIRIDSGSFISNISNISIISISMVVHMLGTAIRKSNRVRSRDSSCTISSLFSIECSIGVVVSNSISIGVRRRLIRVSWLSSMISWGNLDNRGSMDNRGSISRGSMDNRGSVDNWSMNSMNSMNSNRDNSSMSNSNRPISTNS